MCHTRGKYHKAVKKLKRLAATAKAQQIVEASEAGNLALVKELKKTLLDKPLGQTVPECVEGKVTHESILEVFRNCYSELYNSASTEGAMNDIKKKLQGMINENSLREVDKVTGEVVKQACSRMKPGKLDVTGSYSSNIFLHGPDLLFDLLAKVFRSCLVRGHVTPQILSCAFLPLFKGGLKDPSKVDSYRAI